MSFNFADIKANLKGIQDYLERHSIQLSDEEHQALNSIFEEADKGVHKENEKGYDDKQLDMMERNVFINKMESFRNDIKKSIQEFFISVTRREQANVIKEEVPDALNVAKLPQTLEIMSSDEKTKELTLEEKHKIIVNELANKWSKTYNISNQNGKFSEFVEAVYDAAKELNITQVNSKWNHKEYPTEADQIVDEILGIFAQESRFDPKAVCKRKYYGIFQFAEISMKELKLKGSKLKILTMDEFIKLDRITQLKYMTEYIKICKKYYSKLGNQPISAKQLYAMIQFPSLGNPYNKIKFGDKIRFAKNVQSEKEDSINNKRQERDKNAGKLDFTELNN